MSRSKPIDLSKIDASRFWVNVEMIPFHECWEWIAGTQGDGYGSTRNGLAHRISWTLINGAIPSHLCVLHKCDNRSCVRPSHLYLGTDLDNSKDMVSRGHHYRGGPTNPATGDRNAASLYPDRVPRGVKSGVAKLNERDVLGIRAMALTGKTRLEIARSFMISQTNVTNIINRDNWKHI